MVLDTGLAERLQIYNFLLNTHHIRRTFVPDSRHILIRIVFLVVKWLSEIAFRHIPAARLFAACASGCKKWLCAPESNRGCNFGCLIAFFAPETTITLVRTM